ncbi:hypothetical protein [Candidatus Ferrigenium straubiae]|uniref:hypothetical protein n=1 Tax=Candidatus Ferrigenium straubiae TaxID=2919506 RepID=UPI003F4AB1CE
MKTRLGVFIAALLLLPLAGLLLSGHEWYELPVGERLAEGSIAAIPVTALLLLGYALLVNFFVKIRTGNSPFGMQHNYYLAMAAAGAVLGWLIVYLNLFVASWLSGPDHSLLQIMLCTALFALLAPAVLITRALLGSFTGLLKRLARGPALPAPAPETLAFTLLPLAMLGLLGGAAWPAQLSWLLWAAPLLLLVALQLLWHESTIFSSLTSGDWGRVACAVLAGLIVGNLAAMSHRVAGGDLAVSPLFAQAGYALFGLLCLQLGDIIAENWRGKKRSDLFKKKKFSIPIVVKKN